MKALASRRLMRLAGRSMFACIACLPHFAGAQTVYKCESSGRVTYSHEPCLNAKVVDTTPTQGLDKWTGQSRKGRDVQAQELNKAFADGLRPLFNESAEERAKRHRRAQLAPAANRECSALDAQLLEGEAAVRASSAPADTRAAEQRLLRTRLRFRELRC